MRKSLVNAVAVCLAMIALDPITVANDSLRKSLTFHASFDQAVDADFALANKQLYTASSYKSREDAKPGLHHPEGYLAPGAEPEAATCPTEMGWSISKPPRDC